MKKLFTAFILVFVLVFSMAPTVSAANVCTDNVKGNAKATTTFTVTTEGKWFKSTKITFTQTGKGVAKGTTLTGKSKTYETYGCYKVTYVSSDGKHKGTVNFTGRTCTLSLKRNKTYTITIKPYSNQQMHIHNLRKLGFYGWKKIPTWRVKSTGGNIIICG